MCFAEALEMNGALRRLGAAFAALVLLLFATLEGPQLAEKAGWLEGEPVLVFEIPDPARLAGVRAAIGDERVREEHADGFSTHGGRVYVRDVSRAGEFIGSGGWVERPVQIVGLGMDEGGAEDAQSEASPMSPEERRERLRALVQKPSLKRGEQILILKAMNDGIEI